MLRRLNAMRTSDRGFTLIELMVVVIILGVLAAVAIPLYTDYIKNARTSEGVARLGSVMTASKAYYQRYNRWPSRPTDSGYYADFTSTRHFSYTISAGGGGTASFAVQAQGLAVNNMNTVRITMTSASGSADGVVDVTGI